MRGRLTAKYSIVPGKKKTLGIRNRRNFSRISKGRHHLAERYWGGDMISGGVDPRSVGCVAMEGRGWFAEEERGSGDKGPLGGTISTAHCAMPHNRALFPPFPCSTWIVSNDYPLRGSTVYRWIHRLSISR